MVRSKVWALTAFLVFALAGLASAATTYTVDSYDELMEALGVAQPGDTIVVTADITATRPIQIQKNDITVKAAEDDITVFGSGSNVVFLIGAAWEFDPDTSTYTSKRISGVTVEGFNIVGGDIGVLIKNAENCTVKDMTITGSDEGIRLIDASGCKIEDNTIDVAADGIGIFLQNSNGNTLLGNTVTASGLGLFIFESNGNTATGDEYSGNSHGGVVLNDSTENTLQNLTVTDNTGWGVRFVFADGNKLLKSTIRDNSWGGVELLGSQNNLIEGNIVYNNGTADDGSDDAQIVITHGDKEVYTTEVFGEYNRLGDLSEFVEEKFRIYDKLDLLWWWVEEVDTELWDIRQKIATAIGMVEEGEQTPSINAWIDGIIAEKLFIHQHEQTPSGVIQRGFPDSTHRPAAIGDEAHNFTYEGVVFEGINLFEFNGTWHEDEVTVTGSDLDKYEDGVENDFGLDRDGPDDELDTEDDQISWDKLTIIDILILAIRHEIWNDFDDKETDSLKEKLEYLLEKGLITQQDRDALAEKLDAALGFLAQMEAVKADIRDALEDADAALDAAKDALDTGDYTTARTKLLEAKDAIEHAIAIKQELYLLIMDVRYKLCLVDLELPPFPEVNTSFLGKKEKPFADIAEGERTDMVDAIVGALNGDENAQAIRNSARGGTTWGSGDLTAVLYDGACSTGNTIASNLISSNLMTQDRQIGIVIECPHNTIVNNSITNEKVLPIDTELGYGEFHRLDIAMILLADECTIAYNAIEWVDTGIIRGGKWYRRDIQTEYVFKKLAAAAYWPEPGLFRTGCDDPNTPADDPTTYTGDHFDSRVVVWVPVLKVQHDYAVGDTFKDNGDTKDVDESLWLGFAHSQRVRRNRIALNFFEYVGTSIDIVDAESNVIDENLFYNCSNGILFRAPGLHPWENPAVDEDPATDYPEDIYENQVGGAGSNIVLEKNDYYSGVAIHNDSDLAVDANRDYTPPEGTVGHATVIGHVNPPAAPAPNAYENFGTITKYVMLGIEKYYPGDDAAAILPPNLEFFINGVVLPEEKPRHPDDIFAVPQPVCLEETFPGGWNMVSSPVIPSDADPEAVFGDDVPFLVMWEWNGTEYVEPTQIEGTKGYWIWLLEETTLDVCGFAPTTDVEFTLDQAGWHMISTLTTPVYLRHLKVVVGDEEKYWADAVEVGWVRPFAYWWDPIAGEYVVINPEDGVLMPWRGYWIKTLVDDVTIVLPIEYSLENPPEVPTESLGIKATAVSDELPPPPPPAPTPDLSAIDVVNEPNPVRDVNTTVFKVVGPAAAFVEAMRVRIFDASGRLVYEAEVEGPELVWHTQDLTGAYLANGVYLYRVEVKVAGQWITTEVKKLAIYR